VQDVCYFVNNIPNFLRKEEVYVQNINSIFLELREVFKSRGVTAMIE
jgi:hypothetical protein